MIYVKDFAEFTAEIERLMSQGYKVLYDGIDVCELRRAGYHETIIMRSMFPYESLHEIIKDALVMASELAITTGDKDINAIRVSLDLCDRLLEAKKNANAAPATAP